MKVKELDRTVTLAWSPIQQHPVMLAAGTAAQQLDASFSTSATMEIYGLNLSEPGLDLELKSSTTSQSRFHRIVWGGWNYGREGANGVIVGGCDGGRLQIYSAARLLAGEEGVIVARDTHTGPVRGLDFNSYQTNLLASGASDSEIFIWDLNNTTTPMTPGAKSQPNEDVLWLAWNRQVQHILASTFATRCVVWDLRKNEPIMKLSDNNSRVRWKVLEWHPDVATQLCLASEDDSNPVVQLWDLRFASTPIKTMEKHSKGVLSIAWCSQDPDLLMSSGKDNTIYCWNPNTNEPGGEVVCEMVTSYQWNFEVSWCPRNPSLIASCSFDGHASIYSLTGGQQHMQTSEKIADSFPGMEYADTPPVHPQSHSQTQSTAELWKAPKWLRRPNGVSFGFGGKLVTFGSDVRSVMVSQMVSEPTLLDRSRRLQVALASGRFDEISSSLADPIWPYVAATLQPSPRDAIKRLIGYKPDQIPDLYKFLGEPANARLKGDVDRITDDIGSLGQSGKEDELNSFSNSVAPGNGLNFENNSLSAFDGIGENKIIPEEKQFSIPTGDDVNGLICKALLNGSIDLAVELSVKQGRWADAIILAMTGGTDLLAKTQVRYFQQNKGHLSELIGAVVTEDWTPVIRLCDLNSWKEALAAVLTYSKEEELPSLCETLGQRLEAEGGEDKLASAEICYIAARNLSRLIRLRTRQTLHLPTDKLQELVEMVVVLQRGVTADGEGEACGLITHYAELLASQGELGTALSYLQGAQQEKPAELYDRLAVAIGQKPVHSQTQQNYNYYQNQAGGISGQSQVAHRRLSSQSISSWPGQTVGGLHSQPNTPPANPSKPQTFNSMYGAPQPNNMFTPAGLNKPASHQPAPPAMGSTVQQFTPAPAQPPTIYNPTSLAGQPLNPSNPPTNHMRPPANAAICPPGPFNQSVNHPTQQQIFNPPGSVTAPPPPPPANAVPPSSSLRNSPSPAPGLHQGRSKYVLDPSVSGGPMGLSYRNQIGPGPIINQPLSSSQHMSIPPQEQLQQQQQHYNPTEFRNQAYVPQHTGPAGWNDPPPLSGPPRNQPKVEVASQVPITHPLYGSVPQEPVNSFQQPMGMINGGYGDQSMQFQHQQQQQLPPMQPQQYGGMGYNQQPVQPPPSGLPIGGMVPPPQGVPPIAAAKVAEPPKPKAPIPEEHLYLQTVFDELRNRCTCAANNPQSKRKLEEVARKLEMLYDTLRESKLSPATLTGLHQMVQMVQSGDYTGGLSLHTQLISGSDFSQIASFMPGLKVLLQSALQLGVYLQ